MTSDEGNSFLRQRRTVLAGLAGALLLPRIAGAFDVPEVPRLIDHDYSKVRKRFHTKLLQKGPAPDKYEPLDAPPEGEKIFYRSGYGGELELGDAEGGVGALAILRLPASARVAPKAVKAVTV